MEKKHIIIIAVLVVIIAILAVTILSMGNGITIQNNNGTIKISSDDSSISGKLTIYEYKNIKKNANGTYNISQFYDKLGTPKGIKNDIAIKNGKAEYTFHNDTEFFIVDSSIINIKSNDTGNTSTPTITVDYLHNGKSILSSSEIVNSDPEFSEKNCPVSFALDIYSLDGTKLSIDSFNIDYPEFKEAFDELFI